VIFYIVSGSKLTPSPNLTKNLYRFRLNRSTDSIIDPEHCHVCALPHCIEIYIDNLWCFEIERSIGRAQCKRFCLKVPAQTVAVLQVDPIKNPGVGVWLGLLYPQETELYPDNLTMAQGHDFKQWLNS